MHGHESESSEARRRQGRYANYFEIGHNAFEFVLDFGQLYRSDAAARFHTRVVAGPVYAKALLRVLEEAVLAYEREFGAIDAQFADEPGEAVVREPPAAGVTQIVLSAEDPMSAAKEPVPASGLKELLGQLETAIDELKQSIAAGEAALTGHTRALAEAAEILSFSQQALSEQEQITAGYTQALSQFDAASSEAGQGLDAIRASVDAKLDAQAMREIKAAVEAYDRAGSELHAQVAAELSAHQKARDAAQAARDAWDSAKSELEELKADVAARMDAFAAWRASLLSLSSQLAALDPQASPARAFFLLMSFDRLLEQREKADSGAELVAQLDAKCVRLVRARQDLAQGDAAVEDASQQLERARAAEQEHAAKRSETLLAQMAAFDDRPLQEQSE